MDVWFPYLSWLQLLTDSAFHLLFSILDKYVICLTMWVSEMWILPWAFCSCPKDFTKAPALLHPLWAAVWLGRCREKCNRTKAGSDNVTAELVWKYGQHRCCQGLRETLPTLTGGRNWAHPPAVFNNFNCVIKEPDFDISGCPIWSKVLLLF